MNTRVTIFVLIVAVAIGLFAVIKMKPGTGTPSGSTALTDRTSQRLLDATTFDPEKVSAIAITWANGQSASFTKEGSSWSQTKPIAFHMQNYAMRQLITQAADLTVTKTVMPSELEGDDPLKALELDPPAATVVYTLKSSDDSSSKDEKGDQSGGDTKGERTVTVYLGRIFVGGKAYAKLADDDRIYVVDEGLHKRVLQTELKSWRDRTIFPGLDSEMSRISISDYENDSAISLSKINSRWRVIDPVQSGTDTKAIGALTQDLISASIRGFVNDEPSDLSIYGLEDPAGRITVETDRNNEDGSISTIHRELLLGTPIGLSDKTRYAKRADGLFVFTVSEPVVNKLLPGIETLLSKAAVDAKSADVQDIAITGPAGTFHLKRMKEGGWKAVPEWEREPFDVDSTAVESLLARLTGDQKSAALGQLSEADVAESIVITGFGEKKLADLKVGTTDSDGHLRVIFDDGSGVIRYTDDAELPSFNPDDYTKAVEGPKTDEKGKPVKANPDDVSK